MAALTVLRVLMPVRRPRLSLRRAHARTRPREILWPRTLLGVVPPIVGPLDLLFVVFGRRSAQPGTCLPPGAPRGTLRTDRIPGAFVRWAWVPGHKDLVHLHPAGISGLPTGSLLTWFGSARWSSWMASWS